MAQRDRLIGQALIDYMTQNSGQPEKELAKNAGYWRQKKDGSIVINAKEMYQQFARAQGVKVTGVKSLGEKRRRSVGNILRCQAKTGIVPLSQAWLRQIGVDPGGRIQVEVLPESNGQKPALMIVALTEEQTPTPASSAATESAPTPVGAGAPSSLSYV